MWYDKLGIISIGAQCGRPTDGGLSDLKIDLWKLFLHHCKHSYCSSIDHYALALRVGGEFQEFGDERVGSVRRSKADRCISADIKIPQSVWRVKAANELRDYLAARIRSALELCVARLRKDKESVDERGLFCEVDNAIGEFLKLNYD